ncbi:MAG: MgtC/SapB family protein [Nitrospirota bacterium]|jgi:putative Mg2+ transporter-C (MgtC) family protein
MIGTDEVILRLALGVFFGGVIGYERQAHGRPAGFRTHMLVCMASVLLMLLSEHYYEYASPTLDSSFVRIDPARIAAGAITGIGFLGAGVILKIGVTVQGLTTAASIWTVSAIGLATGTGMYLASSVTFVITLVVLLILRAVEKMMSKLIFKILVVSGRDDLEEESLKQVLSQHNAVVYGQDYERDVERREVVLRYTVAVKDTVSFKALLDALSSLQAVKKVSLRSH